MKDVVLSSIINVIWYIWFCRNKLKFENITILVKSAIHRIIVDTSLSGNSSKGHMSASIDELAILKLFSVKGRLSRAPVIKQINWQPPLCGWNKCNSDGATRGLPRHAASGGIFRDTSAAILGCFDSYIGITNSFVAELEGAMLAIEIAHNEGWNHLWLECESLLVVSAFSSFNLVPWKIRNRWRNCMHLCNSMNFRVSHIYKEGNSCAYRLAAYGIYSQCFTWWDLIPDFISEDFFRNRWGLPNYRCR